VGPNPFRLGNVFVKEEASRENVAFLGLPKDFIVQDGEKCHENKARPDAVKAAQCLWISNGRNH
jgi:hypothetical protein